MNLFISRNLSNDSLFHLFTNEGLCVFNESLIDFKAIPFKKPKTDWVFFYSKKGIEFYFQNYDIDSNQKYGVMGPSSGSYFKLVTNHNVNYIGNNNGQEIANSFLKVTQEETITFIKAKNSVASVEQYLSISGNHHGLPVYDNCIKDLYTFNSLEIPSCDIVALTSPLNAEAWFKYRKDSNEKIFAIGKTTASRINSIINKEVPYCTNPSEKDLYCLIKEYLNTKAAL